MNTFKKGDRVVAIEENTALYKKGWTGTIHEESAYLPMVKWDYGTVTAITVTRLEPLPTYTIPQIFN